MAVQLIPTSVLLIGSFWLPFSPRWLLSKGKAEQAWQITQRLHANANDPEDSYARAEYRQMQAQIEFEQEKNAVGALAQAKMAFSQRSFRKRLGLG